MTQPKAELQQIGVRQGAAGDVGRAAEARAAAPQQALAMQ